LCKAIVGLLQRPNWKHLAVWSRHIVFSIT